MSVENIRSKAWFTAICVLALLAVPLANAADPSSAELQRVVNEAHAKYKNLKDGKNADYIPILTTVPSDLFGVVIATREGKVFWAGDVNYKFSIQSVSKPFTAALVMQQQGPAAVAEKIGVEPTGLPFNSKIAIELYEARSANPSVNAGAIAAVSLVQASSEQDRWNQVLQNMRDFAISSCWKRFTNPNTARRGAIARSLTCCITTGACTASRKKRSAYIRSNAPSASIRWSWQSWARRWPIRA